MNLAFIIQIGPNWHSDNGAKASASGPEWPGWIGARISGSHVYLSLIAVALA